MRVEVSLAVFAGCIAFAFGCACGEGRRGEATAEAAVSERAPAPRLTAVKILAVRSAGRPDWETISEGQLATANEHSGEWLEVKTEDVGYGQGEKATLGGYQAAELHVKPVLSDEKTITGLIRIFRFDEWNKGALRYESSALESSTRLSATLRVK